MDNIELHVRVVVSQGVPVNGHEIREGACGADRTLQDIAVDVNVAKVGGCPRQKASDLEAIDFDLTRQHRRCGLAIHIVEPFDQIS
jgi:hypothetical protein